MTETTRRGVLLISLDLPQTGQLADSAGPHESSRVVEQLIDRHQQYQIPATWAASEWGTSQLATRLMNASPRHEMALLAHPRWASCEAGRTRFARELAERLVTARRQGCRIGCLALENGASVQHLDLLVKHRIGLIRDWKDCVGQADPLEQQSVRYGLWRIRPSLTLSRRNRWPWPGPIWSVKRALAAAAGRGALAHVRVDVSRLRAGTDLSLREYERFLGVAARFRRQGGLQPMTMGQLAATLVPAFQSVSGRSILRRAA